MGSDPRVGGEREGKAKKKGFKATAVGNGDQFYSSPPEVYRMSSRNIYL